MADKELFLEVSRATRGGFRIDVTGGTFVLDVPWAAQMLSHMVGHILMPVPKPQGTIKQSAADHVGPHVPPPPGGAKQKVRKQTKGG